MTSQERHKLGIKILLEALEALRSTGANDGEIACLMAALLGAITAEVDCCEEHQEMARQCVLEVFERNRMTNCDLLPDPPDQPMINQFSPVAGHG